MVVASTEGGMSVEEISKKNLKVLLDQKLKLQLECNNFKQEK